MKPQVDPRIQKGPRVRAGWLTTKAAGEPVPFALEDEKLVCMACETSWGDRESFIAHVCTPQKASAVKPEPSQGAKKSDAG